MFILNLLLRSNRFNLLNCLRDSVSQKPLFLLKPGKHYVTLTSFIADLSKLANFAFARMCQIDSLVSIKNLAMMRA